MFIERTISWSLSVFLLLQLMFLALPTPVNAITAQECENLFSSSHEELAECLLIATEEVPTGDVDCDTATDSTCFGVGATNYSENNNPIYQRLNQVINLLSIGVTVAVTLSVVYAGIQWAVSGGEPQKKAAAVNRLWNSAIAILLFVFGWTLLNWLVPGGVLN